MTHCIGLKVSCIQIMSGWGTLHRYQTLDISSLTGFAWDPTLDVKADCTCLTCIKCELVHGICFKEQFQGCHLVQCKSCRHMQASAGSKASHQWGQHLQIAKRLSMSNAQQNKKARVLDCMAVECYALCALMR